MEKSTLAVICMCLCFQIQCIKCDIVRQSSSCNGFDLSALMARFEHFKAENNERLTTMESKLAVQKSEIETIFDNSPNQQDMEEIMRSLSNKTADMNKLKVSVETHTQYIKDNKGNLTTHTLQAQDIFEIKSDLLTLTQKVEDINIKLKEQSSDLVRHLIEFEDLKQKFKELTEQVLNNTVACSTIEAFLRKLYVQQSLESDTEKTDEESGLNELNDD